jgi:hypothetical protein
MAKRGEYQREAEAALNDIVRRRMQNTNESYAEARKRVLSVIAALHVFHENGGETDVFDPDTGRIVGVRDKHGYRQTN